MKIKTRILLYNSLMVPLSLLALLIIGSFVIGLWGRDPADESARAAMTLLNGLETRAMADDATHELTSMGYTLYIFSPAGDDQGEGSALLNLSKTEARALTISGRSYIVRSLPPYLLVAAGREGAGTQQTTRQLLIRFLIVGFISIAVIVALSYLFTSILLRHIYRPLRALSGGAQRVEDGDLSRPIDYRGADEFKAVCDSFDHMQRHLQDERDKNAAYERARTDLVSGISHDLRTPLTSVRGYIKGVRDGIANTPEKVERYLRTAYDKAGEMDQLLQRLFFFSNMETGNMMLNKKDVELCDLVRYYVDETSLEPRAREVIFETDLADGPCVVNADPQMLRRVLTNLTENAMKYAGVSPLRIRLAVRREGAEAVVTFADNGRGVDEKQLPYLFDQFWRGDSARPESGSSTGLGLYIVKYIVDSHGGSIGADSDGGLRLTIRLPLAKEEQQ